jgi:hypothetical protein
MNVGILLTISLSCNTFDKVVKRCSIDTEHMLCYCHDYRLSKEFIGRVGETETLDISECDKLIGVKEWDKLYEAIIRDLSKPPEQVNHFLDL